MRFLATVVGLVALLGTSPALAQGNFGVLPEEPFKLGDVSNRRRPTGGHRTAGPVRGRID